ncbi:hypothetical protein Tco_0906538 [Tanacetum coccineum]|uniref:Uncharacterized protein n=1 Tax=Tanacetum coccineum TaxID=301880 RepID=A0ABQ5CK03_9ASTR
MLNRHKNWLVHKQTACGKDFSNPFMVDNLPKIVGFSTHLASLVKSWLVQDQTVLALASPKANELTIPEQTATGKGTSNPFMAGSLPKTTKPTYPQHIDEFDLKNETSLSECDEEEQNVLYFNDLFPFNVIYLDDSKPDKDNDDDKINISHSSGGFYTAYPGDFAGKEIDKVGEVSIIWNPMLLFWRPIRRIHQGRYGDSVPALTKDHRGIKLNTPYPEDQYAVLEIWNEYNILEDIKRGDLDNSTSDYLISLDSWTSGLLVYKLPLSGLRMMRHFKTLSLDELRSPDFNLLSDQEYSEEEEAEAMAETMEQYMSKTRTDYGSGVARPKIDNKDQFELKGQFLKELRENTFSGSDNEDANEHIEKVLEIVDLFHVPNITVDQLML